MVSYAYLGKSPSFLDLLIKYVSNGTINLMIDSGAFTAYNGRLERSYINVEEYSQFLHSYAKYSEKYVMLDVVGNAVKSKENYEQMLAKGLNPMFVVTMFDNDYDYIRQAVNQNPNICVAGGATTKSDWMTNRFINVYNETSGKAKIHGLAYVTFPRMLQLPLKSVDSASWKLSALRFGNIAFFNKGLKSINYNDVFKGREKLSEHQIRILHKLGVTVDEFKNLKYHKGNYLIACYSNIYANILMQKYCMDRGLDFFLSISNSRDLKKYIYVATCKDKSYKDFRNLGSV